MLLDCRIVSNIDRRYLALYAVMGIDEPKVGPFIPISFYVSASQYWSNKFSSSFLLLFCGAILQNVRSLFSRNNKCFIASSKNTSIDIDIPIL